MASFFEVYDIFFHKSTNKVLNMSENSKLLFPSLGSIASPLHLNENINHQADTYFFCLCSASRIFQLKSIIKMFNSHDKCYKCNFVKHRLYIPTHACIYIQSYINIYIYVCISWITKIFVARFF